MRRSLGPVSATHDPMLQRPRDGLFCHREHSISRGVGVVRQEALAANLCSRSQERTAGHVIKCECRRSSNTSGHICHAIMNYVCSLARGVTLPSPAATSAARCSVSKRRECLKGPIWDRARADCRGRRRSSTGPKARRYSWKQLNSLYRDLYKGKSTGNKIYAYLLFTGQGPVPARLNPELSGF